MRGRMIMRMLMMFGPMLLRQFQKFQRNKEIENQQAPPVRSEENSSEYTDTPQQEKTYTEKDFV